MLKANLDEFHKGFFDDKEKIIEIEDDFKSPINFIYPENFGKNIIKFKKTFEKYDLRYEIFYAHKSNKSKCFLEYAKKENIGVDVASLKELENALDIGFELTNIEATGPKSRIFLEKLLENDILINIDSFSELEEILKIKKEKNLENLTKILIRISGFKNSKISRFGIEIEKKEVILEFIKNYKAEFKLEGFSFHIDTISSLEKAKALEEIFLLHKFFSKNGFYTRKINIGGGFRLSYLDNKESWEKYLELLKKELVDEKLLMSWKKSSFGFNLQNNKVIGEGNIYIPFSSNNSENFLDDILTFELENLSNMKVYEYVKQNLIKIQIEPGRSLHDLTGFTLSKVIGVKNIGNETLVTLDINSFTLGSREQEMFIDPIIISKNIEIKSDDGVFFTGNLCLESDFIYRHKSFLGIIPQVGDLVIFVNTGGYFMDFYENSAILQENAKKIIIDKNYKTYLEN